jgi:hypothetical protein
VLRKSAEVEGRRDTLQASIDRLLDHANENSDHMAELIRRRLLEAKSRWESVASAAQLNQMIGELVGPSIVTADGRLLAVEKTKNPAHINDVHGVIAGGRIRTSDLRVMSVISSKSGTFCEISNLWSPRRLRRRTYGQQVYHVTHVFQSVVYAQNLGFIATSTSETW